MGSTITECTTAVTAACGNPLWAAAQCANEVLSTPAADTATLATRIISNGKCEDGGRWDYGGKTETRALENGARITTSITGTYWTSKISTKQVVTGSLMGAGVLVLGAAALASSPLLAVGGLATLGASTF